MSQTSIVNNLFRYCQFLLESGVVSRTTDSDALLLVCRILFECQVWSEGYETSKKA